MLTLSPPGSPCLRTRAMPFEGNYADLRQDAQNLYHLMVRHQGVGISANQAGLPHRLFVMLRTIKPAGFPAALVAVNPEIVEATEHRDLPEGCITFPRRIAVCRRATTLRVRYLDLKGRERFETLYGRVAQCFQHELDHLNGTLFLDRAEQRRAQAAAVVHVEQPKAEAA